MTVEERQVIATLGALEGLRSGTTTLLEIADHVGEFAESLADTGLRLVLGDNFNDVNPSCLHEGALAFEDGRREEGLGEARTSSANGMGRRMDASGASWRRMLRRHALRNCYVPCGKWPTSVGQATPFTCRKAGWRSRL